MKGIAHGQPIATAFNGQTDEYNILRYGEAVDDLLDLINQGVEVTVYPNGEKTWSAEPEAGTYRLVAWDNQLGGDDK